MLNPKQVAAIRLLYGEHDWTRDELSRQFDTSYETVTKIIRGDTWKEITGGINISRYRKDTEYRCVHIEARLDKGMSYAAIGRELGITGQAVGELVRKYGLGGK